MSYLTGKLSTIPWLLSLYNVLFFTTIGVIFIHVSYAESDSILKCEENAECVNPSLTTSSRSERKEEEVCNCRYIGEEEWEGARLAYLVLVHNERTIDDAAHLFRGIRSPGSSILIHVDAKSDPNAYSNSTLRKEVEDCPCGSEVIVESIHKLDWGKWTMNEPTLWGMETLISHPRFQNKWDVFINISGDSMPVYTPKVIAKLFQGPLANMNFVEAGLLPKSIQSFERRSHKRRYYTDDGKLTLPNITYIDDNGDEQSRVLTIYYGSQWVVLTPAFVRYIAHSMRREDSLPSRFKQHLIEKKRLITDETFIPTLLMNVPTFKKTKPPVNSHNKTLKTLPSMSAIRYVHWMNYSPHPGFLYIEDLAKIKHSGALFIRKVSVAVEPKIVHMLPVDDVDSLVDREKMNRKKHILSRTPDPLDINNYVRGKIRKNRK